MWKLYFSRKICILNTKIDCLEKCFKLPTEVLDMCKQFLKK